MNEIRKIIAAKVRNACIKYDFYTMGDCDEYSNLFDLIRNINNSTTKDLEIVATDIKEHSETDDRIVDIMYILANECCVTYFE